MITNHSTRDGGDYPIIFLETLSRIPVMFTIFSDKLLLQRQSGSSVFNFRLDEWVPNGFHCFFVQLFYSFSL